MTKGELTHELSRLGKGFDADIRPAQVDAFFELFAITPTEAFRKAVTFLLCGPRYPSLAQVQEAVEKAEEEHRKMIAERSRHATSLWMAGHNIVKGARNEQEFQYGQFRIQLLRESIGTGPRQFAKAHFDGIRSWLDSEANQKWAAVANMGAPCGHPEAHKTLLRCLLAECSLWEERYRALPEPEPAQAVLEGQNEPR